MLPPGRHLERTNRTDWDIVAVAGDRHPHQTCAPHCILTSPIVLCHSRLSLSFSTHTAFPFFSAFTTTSFPSPFLFAFLHLHLSPIFLSILSRWLSLW